MTLEMVCIRDFILASSGLVIKESDEDILLEQKNDQKKLKICAKDIHEVLARQDLDGKSFLQVNFTNQSKILITDSLIGFKPVEIRALEMDKIPKVVTTPDIFSVQQAIEDCLQAEHYEELEVLKRVYLSILSGATKIGFEMSQEINWISSLATHHSKAAA